MRRILFSFLFFSILNLIECKKTPIWRHEQVRPVKSVNIEEGPPVNCIVRGCMPRPLFNWTLDGKTLDHREYDITHDEENLWSVSTLTKTLSEADKQKILKCHAFNSITGDGASDFIIINNPPPTKDGSGYLTSVNIEKTSPLKCTVDGSKTAPQVTWFLDDKEVPMSNYLNEYNETSSTATSNFDILGYIKTWPNKIKCSAKSQNSPYVEFAEIYAKGDVSDHNMHIHNNPLRCEISNSRPQPAITWTLDTKTIPNYQYKTVYNPIYFAAVSFLDKKIIESGNASSLCCSAVNPFTKVRHEKCRSLKEMKETQTDIIQFNIYKDPLRCESLGVPEKPNFKWYLNGEELPSGNYSTSFNKKNRIAISSVNTNMKNGKGYRFACVADYSIKNLQLYNETYVTTDSELEILLSGLKTSNSPVEYIKLAASLPLQCIVFGSKPAAVISWFIDNEEVPPGAYSYFYIENTKKTISDFDILSYMDESAKRITCLGRNPDFPLNVKTATILTKNFLRSEMYRSIPEIFTLTNNTYSKYPLCCDIDSLSSRPVFNWYMDSDVIESYEYTSEYNPETGATKSCLTMGFVENLVRCVSKNKFRPRLLRNNKYEVRPMGITPNKYSICCGIDSSSPRPIINWDIEGQRIETNESKVEHTPETKITKSCLNSELLNNKVENIVRCEAVHQFLAHREISKELMNNYKDTEHDVRNVIISVFNNSLMCITYDTKSVPQFRWFVNYREVSDHTVSISQIADKRYITTSHLKVKLERDRANFVICVANGTGIAQWNKTDIVLPESEKFAVLKPGYGHIFENSIRVNGLDLAEAALDDICEYQKKTVEELQRTCVRAPVEPGKNLDPAEDVFTTDGVCEYEQMEENSKDKFAGVIVNMKMILEALELEANFTLEYLKQGVKQIVKFTRDSKEVLRKIKMSKDIISRLPQPTEHIKNVNISILSDLNKFETLINSTHRNLRNLILFLGKAEVPTINILHLNIDFKNDIYKKGLATIVFRAGTDDLLKLVKDFTEYYKLEIEECLSENFSKYESYFTYLKDVVVNAGKLINSFSERLLADNSSSKEYLTVYFELLSEMYKQENVYAKYLQFSKTLNLTCIERISKTFQIHVNILLFYLDNRFVLK